MEGHASLIRVNNIELQLGQNLLHGFQIQSCPGDVWCLFILLLQCQKTACLADGVGDALLLVCFRFAQPCASFAPCFGNKVARVSAGFVDHFLTVGHGVRDVLERLDNRSVESHCHNARRHDANAAAPTVQEFLRLGFDAFLHGDPPPGQYLVDGHADDRLGQHPRSEEHTSELQSRAHLVCRLLLEKKKKPPSTHPPLSKKKNKHQL